MTEVTRTMVDTRKMVLASIFAAIMAVCAWISIPVLEIAFTMQTFAVFLALGVLGGKWGTVSILIYMLLGAVGMPVFSGFRGGPRGAVRCHRRVYHGLFRFRSCLLADYHAGKG